MTNTTEYNSTDRLGNPVRFVGVYRTPGRVNQRLPLHQRIDGTYVFVVDPEGKSVNIKKLEKVA